MSDYEYIFRIHLKFKIIIVFFYHILTLIMLPSFVLAGNLKDGRYENNNKVHNKEITLYKIKLIYYHDFNYKKKYDHEKINGCAVVIKKTKNKKIKNKRIKKILQCREYISLLRSRQVSSAWRKEYKQSGSIVLNIPEFGIKNVHAYLVGNEVEDTEKNTENMPKITNGKGFVTGAFIRHVLSIKEYIFKNIHTGKIIKINITPQHLFYVKNKRKFVPISRVLPTDNLLTLSGEKIQLICLTGKECGRELHSGRPVQVYNIEVYRRHTYGVGVFGILAHNICNLVDRLKQIVPDLISTRPSIYLQLSLDEDNFRHSLCIIRDEDVNRAFFALREIYGEKYITCDTGALLLAARMQNRTLDILHLESMLNAKVGIVDGQSSVSGMYWQYLYRLESSLGNKINYVKEGDSPALSDLLTEEYQAMYACTKKHAGIIERRPGNFYMFSSWSKKNGVYTAVHILPGRVPANYYIDGKFKIVSCIKLQSSCTM